MCRIALKILIFFNLLPVFLDGTRAHAQNLEPLVRLKRYDQVVTVSLYELSLPSCKGSCRDKATLNAMRGSILIGDFDGALLFASGYLEKPNGNKPETFGLWQTISLLKTYSLALTGDSKAFQSNMKSLSSRDQDRLYRLAIMDVPFIANEVPEPQTDPKSMYQASNEEKGLWEKYEQTPRKSAWFAGVSNLIVPGFGYAYLGMWQTAALDALITGICIGSSVELFRRDLYFSGATVATVGSVFYLGGALGAARSANEINRKNLKGTTDQLRSILLPELRFEF